MHPLHETATSKEQLPRHGFIVPDSVTSGHAHTLSRRLLADELERSRSCHNLLDIEAEDRAIVHTRWEDLDDESLLSRLQDQKAAAHVIRVLSKALRSTDWAQSEHAKAPGSLSAHRTRHEPRDLHQSDLGSESAVQDPTASTDNRALDASLNEAMTESLVPSFTRQVLPDSHPATPTSKDHSASPQENRWITAKHMKPSEVSLANDIYDTHSADRDHTSDLHVTANSVSQLLLSGRRSLLPVTKVLNGPSIPAKVGFKQTSHSRHRGISSVTIPDAGRPPSIRAIHAATRVLIPSSSSSVLADNAACEPLIRSLALRLIQNAVADGLDLSVRRTERNDGMKETTIGHPEPSEKVFGAGAPAEAAAIKDSNYAKSTHPDFSIRTSARATGNLTSTISSWLSRSWLNSPSEQITISPASTFVAVDTSELDRVLPKFSLPPPLRRTDKGKSARSQLTSVEFVAGDYMSYLRAEGVQNGSRTLAMDENQDVRDHFGFTYTASYADLATLSSALKRNCSCPSTLNGLRWSNGIHAKELDPQLARSCPTCSNHAADRPVASLTSEVPQSQVYKEAVDHRGHNAAATSSPAKACGHQLQMMVHDLAELHARLQAHQTSLWDEYLKQSSRRRKKPLLNVREQGKQRKAIASAQRISQWTDTGFSPEDDHQASTQQLNRATLDDKEASLLSRAVGNGIPLVGRSKVWTELCNCDRIQEPGLYSEYTAAAAQKLHDQSIGDIEKDVARTMPTNAFFGGHGHGVAKLSRILGAFSVRNSPIGYCQGMNLVAAALLLISPDEEDAFWLLTSIVEDVLPSGFYEPPLYVSRACPLVLADLVHIHLPSLSQHLTSVDIDLAAVSFPWFLSIFTDCLPVETLFRVWDVLLCDGFAVMFRVALAVFDIYQEGLQKCSNTSDTFVFLEKSITQLWDADNLLNIAQGRFQDIKANDVLDMCAMHAASFQ